LMRPVMWGIVSALLICVVVEKCKGFGLGRLEFVSEDSAELTQGWTGGPE